MKKIICIVLAAIMLAGGAALALASAPTATENTVTVGDIIPFGNYDWLVLDVQGHQALVITEQLIAMRAYNHTQTIVTWETSTIRTWLNDDFFGTFSAADQARVVLTTVVTNENPRHLTFGGNDTQDYVFLLSIEEVVQYFGDSGQLAIRPNMIYDQYNQARSAASWWWLRSPGFNQFHAAFVGDVGYISGDFVNHIGGIRPAMWIDLTQEGPATTTTTAAPPTSESTTTATTTTQPTTSTTTTTTTQPPPQPPASNNWLIMLIGVLFFAVMGVIGAFVLLA